MKKFIFTIVALLCFMPIINAEDYYEAQIGEVKYNSIVDAIEAAKDNDEIILLNDVGRIIVNNGKKITINLNKKTAGDIYNNSNVTIKNGTVTHSIFANGVANAIEGNMILDEVTFIGGGNFKNAILNHGNLTVKNIVCDNTDPAAYNIKTCIGNEPEGTVTINGGSFHVHNYNNGGKVIINGGNFEETTFQNTNGTITINGGNFNSVNNTLVTNTRGNVVINKGNFNVSGLVRNYDGEYIWNEEKIPSTVTMNGGTITSTGNLFETTGFSSYNKITINGGKITSSGCVIYAVSGAEIAIKGGEIVYTGPDKGHALDFDGTLTIGEDDGNVKDTAPIIKLNGGVIITDHGTEAFKFYDGKFTLKEKISISGWAKTVLPEGYYIKYDDIGNSMYNAYLAKVKQDEPIAPEEDKKEEDKEEQKQPEKEEIKEEQKQPEKEEVKEEVKDVEETVENPPTGLYISLGMLGVLVIGIVGYLVLQKKNYFNKI